MVEELVTKTIIFYAKNIPPSDSDTRHPTHYEPISEMAPLRQSICQREKCALPTFFGKIYFIEIERYTLNECQIDTFLYKITRAGEDLWEFPI